MKNKNNCNQFAKQILQMSNEEVIKTLNNILKCVGEKELDRIVLQFSKVLGGML